MFKLETSYNSQGYGDDMTQVSLEFEAIPITPESPEKLIELTKHYASSEDSFLGLNLFSAVERTWYNSKRGDDSPD